MIHRYLGYVDLETVGIFPKYHYFSRAMYVQLLINILQNWWQSRSIARVDALPS